MNSEIAAAIKLLRKQRQLTQQEMASQINMSQNAYSQLEAGKTKIDLDRLNKIATVFQLTPIELLTVLSGNK